MTQAQWQLQYIDSQQPSQWDKSKIQRPNTATNKSEIPTILDTLIQQFHEQAYLAASIDSIQYLDSTRRAKVYFYLGPKLKIGTIKWIDSSRLIPKYLIQEIKQLQNTVAEHSRLQTIRNKIRQELNQAGYARAQIYFRNKSIENNQINFDIAIKPKQQIRWGVLELETEQSPIRPSVLQALLQIKENSVFNPSSIAEIERKIKTIPYLKLSKKPDLRIDNNTANLNLAVEAHDASRFDFLIGIQPQSTRNNSYSITGEITMDLKNPLHYGESIYLKYKRIKLGTQDLDFQINVPYLLGLPFGVELAFNLLKNDLLARDIQSRAGLVLYPRQDLSLQIFTGFKSSRLIQVDTNYIIQNQRLPDALDYQLNTLGTLIDWNRLDYIWNPRRGIRFRQQLSIGRKAILPNLQVTSLQADARDFSMAYDSLKDGRLHIESTAQLEHYTPFTNRISLKTAIQAGVKWDRNKIGQNEKFRIGGTAIMRGFDEASLVVQDYICPTIEARYLLDQKSFFALFVDYALLHKQYNSTKKWQQVYSFGSGLHLQTKVGVFAFYLALGKSESSKLDYRNIKTHLGFVSQF